MACSVQLNRQMQPSRKPREQQPPWKRHEPVADPTWRIEQEGFDPSREREMETLFTLGNGYLGVRGSLESPLAISQADLFIAGIYDRKSPVLPYSELEFLTPDSDEHPFGELASFPFPFQLFLKLNGTPLTLFDRENYDHSSILDMKKGLSFDRSVYRFSHGGEPVVLTTMRCCSAIDRHLLMHDIEINAGNSEGLLEISTSMHDPHLALNHPHLNQLPSPEGPAEVLLFETKSSGLKTCLAAKVNQDGKELDVANWTTKLVRGKSVRVRRYVSAFTTLDIPHDSKLTPDEMASAHLAGQHWSEFDAKLLEHEREWEARYERADITFEGSPSLTQAQRFNIYHLLIAADHDPRTSIAARTLSGRAYGGHIFWDAEIFLLPFFLHTFPEIARTLLMYRYYTLPGARKRAHRLGYRGACYAWESTVTGEDVTPKTIILRSMHEEIPIFTGTQQVHITADIAFALWRYWEATGDDEFMRGYGCEMFVETARFWVTRCQLEADQLYHIAKVVGPDEYHHNVTDNAFTNWMARHNVRKAIQTVQWMKERFPRDWQELTHRLKFGDHELREWKDLEERLFLPQPNQDGVIEQFQGYFSLRDVQIEKKSRFKAPVKRLLDWHDVNQTKVIKQADTLMLFFLFPDLFSKEIIRANYDYYEAVCDHGSSLSPPVHAMVAARLGLIEIADQYYRQSLELDLMNLMQNTALGIHAACMGGAWQALMFGYLGVRFQQNPDPDLRIDPAGLPKGVRSISFNLRYRERVYSKEDVA